MNAIEKSELCTSACDLSMYIARHISKFPIEDYDLIMEASNKISSLMDKYEYTTQDLVNEKLKQKNKQVNLSLVGECFGIALDKMVKNMKATNNKGE